MGVVRGCEFPDDLYYHIDDNVWVRRGDDGVLTVGLTSYARAAIGRIVSCTPKRPGKPVERHMSCATIESEDWVGPVKSPVSGEVVAANNALADDLQLINDDPYGAGWLVQIRPDDWDAESAELLSGDEALRGFEARMAADDFTGC